MNGLLKFFILIALLIGSYTGSARTTKVTEINNKKDIQDTDPNADRIGGSNTAECLPSGKSSISVYNGALIQGTWAIGDRTEVSISGLLPIFQITAIGSIKHQFYKTQKLRMAVQGFIGSMYVFIDKDADLTIFGGGGGTILDVCLKPGCHSMISFGLRAGVGDIVGKNSTMGIVDNLNTTGLFYVSSKVKLYAGINLYQLVLPVTKKVDDDIESESFGDIGFVYLNYGIRIHGSSFAVDLGLIRPIFVFFIHKSEIKGVEDVMKYLPIGYPSVSFTYRL